MAICVINAGGGGTSSDDVAATKDLVLEGYTALTVDSDDEPIEGTMRNFGESPTGRVVEEENGYLVIRNPEDVPGYVNGGLKRPMEDFGDAIANHVLEEETFTSESGLNILGEMRVASLTSFSVATVSNKTVTFKWTVPENTPGRPYSGVIAVYKEFVEETDEEGNAVDQHPTSIHDGIIFYMGAGDNTEPGSDASITYAFPSTKKYCISVWSYVTCSAGEDVEGNTVLISKESIQNEVNLGIKEKWFYITSDYTVPEGCTADFYIIGGGGGGSRASVKEHNMFCGGGGGSGYVTTVSNVAGGSSITGVSIGAGGSGGIGGSGSQNLSGSNGGSTKATINGSAKTANGGNGCVYASFEKHVGGSGYKNGGDGGRRYDYTSNNATSGSNGISLNGTYYSSSGGGGGGRVYNDYGELLKDLSNASGGSGAGAGGYESNGGNASTKGSGGGGGGGIAGRYSSSGNGGSGAAGCILCHLKMPNEIWKWITADTVVPDGYTATIYLIGGGGGGSRSHGSQYGSEAEGGAGGGSGYITTVQNVPAGTTISDITIGAAGTGSASSITNGVNGGQTKATIAGTVYTANGGNGGNRFATVGYPTTGGSGYKKGGNGAALYNYKLNYSSTAGANGIVLNGIYYSSSGGGGGLTSKRFTETTITANGASGGSGAGKGGSGSGAGGNASTKGSAGGGGGIYVSSAPGDEATSTSGKGGSGASGGILAHYY